MVSAFYSVVWISALGIQVGKEFKSRLAQAHQFNSTTVTRGGGTSSSTSFFTGAHFVHPRATILAIASINKACFTINADFIVEALVSHVCIDFASSIAFPELQALEVNPESFLDHILEWLILLNFKSCNYKIGVTQKTKLQLRQVQARQSRLWGKVEKLDPGICASHQALPGHSSEWSRATTKSHLGS